MKPEKFIIRSSVLRRAAKDQSCVNCGVNDGTVVAAHYQGMRSQTFGKGKGIKPHDICVADLCVTCHQEFDAGKGSYYEDSFLRKIDLSERFMFCVMQTIVRRIHDGVLYTDDIKRD